MNTLTTEEADILRALDGYSNVKVTGDLKEACVRMAKRGLVSITAKTGGKLTVESFVTVLAAGRKAIASAPGGDPSRLNSDRGRT